MPLRPGSPNPHPQCAGLGQRGRVRKTEKRPPLSKAEGFQKLGESQAELDNLKGGEGISEGGIIASAASKGAQPPPGPNADSYS